jgi:hypothetical protein
VTEHAFNVFVYEWCHILPEHLLDVLAVRLAADLPMSTTAILSASLLAAAVLKCCSLSMTSRSSDCCSVRDIDGKSRPVLPWRLSSPAIALRTRALLMPGMPAALPTAGVSMNSLRLLPLGLGLFGSRPAFQSS